MTSLLPLTQLSLQRVVANMNNKARRDREEGRAGTRDRVLAVGDRVRLDDEERLRSGWPGPLVGRVVRSTGYYGMYVQIHIEQPSCEVEVDRLVAELYDPDVEEGDLRDAAAASRIGNRLMSSVREEMERVTGEGPAETYPRLEWISPVKARHLIPQRPFGLPDCDGYQTAVGDRVFVSTGIDAGVWVLTGPGRVATRSLDMPFGKDVTNVTLWVENGYAHGTTAWVGNGRLGSQVCGFSQLAGMSEFTASRGIQGIRNTVENTDGIGEGVQVPYTPMPVVPSAAETRLQRIDRLREELARALPPEPPPTPRIVREAKREEEAVPPPPPFQRNIDF